MAHSLRRINSQSKQIFTENPIIYFVFVLSFWCSFLEAETKKPTLNKISSKTPIHVPLNLILEPKYFQGQQ